MVNVDTLWLIAAINELAEGLKNGGLTDFETYEGEDYKVQDGVLYDSKKENRIVLDCCLFPEHHDIVGHYDDMVEGCKIKAVLDEKNGGPYILVEFDSEKNGEDRQIIIDEGFWYFA